jgi:hypothetical protein
MTEAIAERTLNDSQMDTIRGLIAGDKPKLPIAILTHEGTLPAADLDAMFGEDEYQIVDLDVSDEVEPTKPIVFVKVDRLDAEYVLGMMTRLPRTQQIVCLLKGRDHTDRFVRKVLAFDAG